MYYTLQKKNTLFGTRLALFLRHCSGLVFYIVLALFQALFTGATKIVRHVTLFLPCCSLLPALFQLCSGGRDPMPHFGALFLPSSWPCSKNGPETRLGTRSKSGQLRTKTLFSPCSGQASSNETLFSPCFDFFFGRFFSVEHSNIS